MAEDALNQSPPTMEARPDIDNGEDRKIQIQGTPSPPAVRQAELSDDEEDSIERDLKLMGIIVPKPDKPPVKGRRPRRSLNAATAGSHHDASSEEQREPTQRRHNVKSRQTATSSESKPSGVFAQSRKVAEHAETSSASTTFRDALSVSDSQLGKEDEPSNDSEWKPDSTTPFQSSNASSIAITSQKRKRLAHGKSASGRPLDTITTIVANEDLPYANEASPTPPDMDSNADGIAQTRSGRKVHRPAALVVEDYRKSKVKREHDPFNPGNLASAKSHRQKRQPGMRPAANGRRQRLTKAGAQDHDESCARCERTSASNGNLFVYCEKCNKCWHQFCHDPPIDSHIIEDKLAHWTCVVCKSVARAATPRSREPSQRAIKDREGDVLMSTPPSTPPRRELGGSEYSAEECRRYLASLSHSALVNLVLDISKSSPNLPLFPADLRKPASASFTTQSTPSTATEPASVANIAVNLARTPERQVASSNAPNGIGNEETEAHLVGEHRLYPKPGNGFRLPPIEEDMHIMVEDSNCAMLSHTLHGLAAATTATGLAA